jgi:hypothetical protein
MKGAFGRPNSTTANFSFGPGTAPSLTGTSAGTSLIIGAAGLSASANLINVGMAACGGTSADKIRSIVVNARASSPSSQTGLQNHLSIRAIMAVTPRDDTGRQHFSFRRMKPFVTWRSTCRFTKMSVW